MTSRRQPDVTAADADPVVAFYAGAPDDRERTLDQILAWDDRRLEAVHDYIQWVFPTRQPSGVNPVAPLVTAATARAFAAHAGFRERLRTSLDRMLAFYGLRRSPEGRVEIDPDWFDDRAAVWLHPGNHNHLRLTRILDSLAALGLGEEAAALRRCLVEDVAAIPGGASARTVEFWRRAGR